MTTETTARVRASATASAVSSACEDTAIRVCIVYDCLFPYTIGGAERWYRNLAERLAGAGHEVTILTLRQWDKDASPDVAGVSVVAAGPRMGLYTERGRRRVLPPLVFGLGVLAHLARHGRRYDVVHTASFPFFPLLAIAALQRVRRFRVVVDWHEVWTRGYWVEYLGGIGGRIGWAIQRLCLRVPQRAFCFSRLHERRLRELGIRGEVTRLEGQYDGPTKLAEPASATPVAVFAGRHIPEKNVTAVVPAIALARGEIPELRGVIYGDGPEREKVLRSISDLGLDGAVSAPGFVASAVLDEALSTALCLVLPSRREGYGLVVIEAAARGVPSVVVDGPDNAATELVEDGVNGAIAPSSRATDLADAIVRVRDAGAGVRSSTAEWYARNSGRLSLDGSLRRVVESYEFS